MFAKIRAAELSFRSPSSGSTCSSSRCRTIAGFPAQLPDHPSALDRWSSASVSSVGALIFQMPGLAVLSGEGAAANTSSTSARWQTVSDGDAENGCGISSLGGDGVAVSISKLLGGGANSASSSGDAPGLPLATQRLWVCVMQLSGAPGSLPLTFAAPYSDSATTAASVPCNASCEARSVLSESAQKNPSFSPATSSSTPGDAAAPWPAPSTFSTLSPHFPRSIVAAAGVSFPPPATGGNAPCPPATSSAPTGDTKSSSSFDESSLGEEPFSSSDSELFPPSIVRSCSSKIDSNSCKARLEPSLQSPDVVRVRKCSNAWR
mmetsp:Transcript_18064/g.45240  ORF Transcript_18064/g.45240 Transcript_18064/m.45240 type:complete len:320 (-) Transcript_18064:3276-4235(-)